MADLSTLRPTCPCHAPSLPTVFSEQLASEPNSTDRLPTNNVTKEFLRECCTHTTFPSLGSPQSHKHNLISHPERLTPVPVAPQVPETHPMVFQVPHDRWYLSSRHANTPPPHATSSAHRHRNPSSGAMLFKTGPCLRSTEMRPRSDAFQLKGKQPTPPNRHIHPALWYRPEHLHQLPMQKTTVHK